MNLLTTKASGPSGPSGPSGTGGGTSAPTAPGGGTGVSGLGVVVDWRWMGRHFCRKTSSWRSKRLALESKRGRRRPGGATGRGWRR